MNYTITQLHNYLLISLISLCWVGCESPNKNLVRSENEPQVLTKEWNSTSSDSLFSSSGSQQNNSECDTCIDPPGGGSGGSCIPTDTYRLEGKVNNSGAYTYNSNIPSHKLTPYWGSIIQTGEFALENTSQNGASSYHDNYPFHEIVNLDRKAKITTTLLANGQLEFSLTLYELFAKAWFNSNSVLFSDAIVTASADDINVTGLYTIASDSFLLTDFEFTNLDVDLSLTGFTGWAADALGYSTSAESEVEFEIKDLIQSEIDNFNEDNPNRYIRSVIDYPEIDNILPILDQAIAQLVNNDIEASLDIEVPNCDYYPNRDGLILLEIDTNP